jgi:putative addiction module killer protein
MARIRRTGHLLEWLDDMKDIGARHAINRRIKQAKAGNFGDCAAVGEGISEMRLHYGPGYRLYFTQTGRDEYLLLTGGDKGTQRADIERAKAMKRELERAGL